MQKVFRSYSLDMVVCTVSVPSRADVMSFLEVKILLDNIPAMCDFGCSYIPRSDFIRDIHLRIYACTGWAENTSRMFSLYSIERYLGELGNLDVMVRASQDFRLSGGGLGKFTVALRSPIQN